MNSSLPATPADALQRAEALDPTRSFCVTAPAGSGKTELLSQRVLALLARVDNPEEILAVTFTRKAAAEMRQRIFAALQLAATEPEPEAAHRRQTWQLARDALRRDAECGWNLLRNPARLRVQTIDGLCSSLTAQMPVLSNFGGQPRIADQAAPLYLEAVNALLEQLEQPGALADSLAQLLEHVDNQVERCQRLLVALLARRDQWLPHIGGGIRDDHAEDARAYLEQGLRQIQRDALERAAEVLAVYEGELLELLDFAASRCRENDPDHELAVFAGCEELPAPTPENHGLWLRLSNWLLTGKGEWRKRLTVKEGFPVGKGADKTPFQARKDSMQALLDVFALEAQPLREWLVEIRHLPSVRYSDSQWRILAHITRVLPAAASQLLLVFARRGVVDFTQISLSAQDALGDELAPSDLWLRLDARIRHLLIDEFQDTSTSQFKLVKRLVEGWREHNESGASPQTLFIVGDGMQSIYGFREANVGLFLEARRRGVNNLELIDAPLSVNFRSTPAVIGWINRVFADAFPKIEHSARGAVPYAQSFAFKTPRDDSHVAVFGLRDEDGSRASEAAHCVQLVQQALAADSEGTVAILVRYRSHLRAIVPALQRAGIAWRATDIDPLAQRAAIQDLLTLLKALLNPADRISWLALLRTPMVGLDNADLHALATGTDGAGLRQTLWSRLGDAQVRATLSSDGAARVDQAWVVLDMALAQRGRKSLRSWLEGVWLALGGHLTLTGDAEWRDVQRLLELVEQLAPEFSLEVLEQRLENLYARAEVQPNTRVVVMTIHKSKGLEFDTVIVPGLDRGTALDDKALLQWGEYLSEADRSHLVLAARPAAGAEDSIYDYLEYERKQKQKLEDARLLYVAVTRAKTNLYLLFSAKADADMARGPASNSLLARIWPAVSDEVIWPPTQTNNTLTMAPDFSSALRVPSQWRIELPAPAALSQDANIPPALEADSLEARIGTVIHQLLQQLVAFGENSWRARDAARKRVLAAQLLRQQGALPAQIDAAAEVVCQTLDTMLNDERGRWLLGDGFIESHAEWELIAQERRYVIDRCFVDTDDVRWIVDYKSSVPRTDETLMDFIEREVAAYRPQLQTYRKLVAQLDTRVIKTALYFPRIAHWQEIDCLE